MWEKSELDHTEAPPTENQLLWGLPVWQWVGAMKPTRGDLNLVTPQATTPQKLQKDLENIQKASALAEGQPSQWPFVVSEPSSQEDTATHQRS